MKFAFFSRLSIPLVCAVAAIVGLMVPAAVKGQGTQAQTLQGHVPAATARLAPVGLLDRTKRLRLAIGLPPRNQAGLQQFLKDLYDPTSANFRKYLTPAQFAEQFGPTEADYAAVAAFASAHHLTVTDRHPNRLILDVEAAVPDVETAFHVRMRTYQHPTEQRQFFAPDAEPSLDLATPVLRISGLDDYARPHPNLVRQQAGAANATPNAGSSPSGSYAGGDFRAAYVPGTTLTGAGQTVGLLQFDGFYANDIAAYATQFGIPSIPLTVVPIDGGVSTPGSGNDEVSLDIEMVMAMAPGVTRIYVYEAPNPSPFVDLLSRMANDNLSQQLSCSWSGGGPNASAEVIFQQMAAQGQSFFNATGDSDAFTGSISFPSDSPNITEVGGTNLTTNGPGGSYVSETAWNRNNNVGSSGGISPTYSIPSWQQSVSMASNQGSTTMRNVPDVALTGENVYVRYANGGSGNFGGTSCAAPLWAGYTALVNQQAAAQSVPSVGFINPFIYTLGQDFNDITVGNNFSSSSPSKFSAVVGYDLCTGLGTPGNALIPALILASSSGPPTYFRYSTNPATYPAGTAITPNAPSSRGGAVSSYSVSPALPSGLALDPTTGIVSGTPTLNTSAANYTVTATNSSGSATVQLNITIGNLPPSNLTYSANPVTYTKGVAISPNNPSSSGGPVASYTVSPSLPSGLSLNSSSGVITGTPTAVTSARTYTVTATNSSGFTSVGVRITVNDAAPSGLTYSTNPAVYTNGTAITANNPSNGGGTVVSYSVSPTLPAGLKIKSNTGVITGTPTAISAAADYIVTATNTGGSTTVDLNITVNDVPPSALVYSSNPAVYTKGVAITANHPSNSGGTVISYSVSPALPAGLSMSTSTGIISGTPTAITPSNAYTVTATNSGGSTNASLTLTVNDVAPSNLTYSTNPAAYTKGVAITANSPSSGGGAVISYSVTPSLPAGLTLSTSTGVISGTPTVISASSTYTVKATNSGGFTTVGLTLAVNDIAPSNLTYSTNPATYVRGTAITANGPSSSGGVVVSYSVSPALPAGLSLNTSTGIISGTPTVVSASNGFTITATNSGGFTTAPLTLTVNDIAPSNLAYSANPATYTKGLAITSNSPSNGGGTVVSYSVSPTLPAGLSLNTSNGAITGTPTAITPSNGYTVTATNSGGFTTAVLTIAVNDAVPSSLTYSANPAAYTKGVAITANNPSNGGGAVVSYSVSPSLPAGLTLNTSTGVVSGTPTAITASNTYTVTATNSGGSTTVGLTLAVNDVAPASLAYSANPATYTLGAAIAANTPSNGGGTVISYSVSPALPAGLSLNTSTGVISGTPTAVAASSGYTITATNSGGFTTAVLTLAVNDVPPVNLAYSTNPATYTLGAAITANTPSNSGGTVTSYSISPALPAGLSLNTSNGAITGTPTAISASAGYTITATNSGGFTTALLTLAVNDVAPSNLAYSANPVTYTRGAAIPANTPSSSGGTVISYSVSPALPAGLALNTSTGVITGTPMTVAASRGYTITATNSGGFTTALLTLAVNDVAPANLAYSTNPATYTRNAAIAANTPSSAGGPVVSYSVSPALPAGLSFSTSTGVITGTPTANSASTGYTITATNSGGFTTVLLTLTVNDIAPANLAYSTNPAIYVAGAVISANNPSSSGGPVVTYSAPSGLPAGLSVDSTTGAITGTPTTISSSAAYTVTATNTGGSTNSSLNITIVSPMDGWRQQYFGTTSNTGNAADTADPFHTGIPNLLAFAFFGPNQDPAHVSVNQLPQMQMSGGNVIYSFTQPAGVSGITYGAQWSTTVNAGSWTAISDTGSGNTHTFSVPVAGNTQIFIRLTVTDP